jgi:hypothetical protein
MLRMGVPVFSQWASNSSDVVSAGTLLTTNVDDMGRVSDVDGGRCLALSLTVRSDSSADRDRFIDSSLYALVERVHLMEKR